MPIAVTARIVCFIRFPHLPTRIFGPFFKPAPPLGFWMRVGKGRGKGAGTGLVRWTRFNTLRRLALPPPMPSTFPWSSFTLSSWASALCLPSTYRCRCAPGLGAILCPDDIVMGFGPPEGDTEVWAALEFATRTEQ